jgi:hypothetical protein
MDSGAKPSYWTTLPGVLTGVAALLTAATGLYVAVRGTKGSTVVPKPDTTATRPDTTVRARNPVASTAPVFVRFGSFPISHPAEYVVHPGQMALTDTLGFLRLTDAGFGSGDRTGAAPDLFKFELTLTNTTTEPIQLDLSDRFFSLSDDRGHRATLLYFCCAAQGELLSPSQARTLVLFFRSREWYGKELSAHAIQLRVAGLLPVERATWQFRPLATAN